MGLTASRLKELNLIDSIVQEPLGGAHRNYAKMAENLKLRLKEDLAEARRAKQRRIIKSTL